MPADCGRDLVPIHRYFGYADLLDLGLTVCLAGSPKLAGCDELWHEAIREAHGAAILIAALSTRAWEIADDARRRRDRYGLAYRIAVDARTVPGAAGQEAPLAGAGPGNAARCPTFYD